MQEKDQAVNQILPNKVKVKGQYRSMYKTVVKSKMSYSRSIRPWGHICYYTITQQSSQPSHPDPYTVIICKQLVAGPQEKKSGALPTIKLPQTATKSGATRSIFTNGLLVLLHSPRSDADKLVQEFQASSPPGQPRAAATQSKHGFDALIGDIGFWEVRCWRDMAVADDQDCRGKGVTRPRAAW